MIFSKFSQDLGLLSLIFLIKTCIFAKFFRMLIVFHSFYRCAKSPRAFARAEKRDMVCSRPMKGRYVYVTLRVTEILTVCEVEVFPIKGSAVEQVSSLTGLYFQDVCYFNLIFACSICCNFVRCYECSLL